MALTLADRRKIALRKPISICLHIFSIQTCVTTSVVCTCKKFLQTSARKPKSQFPISRLILSRQRSRKCVGKGLKVYAMDRAISKLPFELGRLQNLQLSEDTFGHVLIPLNKTVNIECPVKRKVLVI